jgi:BirA family biotin operon repressor/biotin-[acetyl-CoA-carboxylase] ligase
VSLSLEPERVLPLLSGRFGRPYLYEASCASTQHLLPPEAPEGAVAVCDEQTAGRGRLGRAWQAPAGTSILCSVMLRPPPERPAAQLSLVGAVAVARLVEGATRMNAQVKWPNDVLLAGAKVAGILAEGRDGAVVLGIGLNVNQASSELPERAGPPAGSLRTADGTLRDRPGLLAGLLRELEQAYDAWFAGGLEAIRSELEARDALLDSAVDAGGARGVARGLGPAGELVVETDDGRVLVSSGEVRAL